MFSITVLQAGLQGGSSVVFNSLSWSRKEVMSIPDTLVDGLKMQNETQTDIDGNTIGPTHVIVGPI